ncbi:polyamine-modulated factor 1-binding protein 1-like [Branchiostoma floridae]|uniref:Polyamine-modulated factor 1-binding protein 1-like n=1 Tax=Branchiostoma floridae TaxID=7739 RepID=A0A9J7L9P6_BRAFL|nr:polyamine-modulated factor 1-binding protein 1-like [Branchiostoma floridae]
MPFRRLFRERADSRAERPVVENRDTYRNEIESLRNMNATLARQMLQQEAQFEEEKEELRKKMRRQDARMLMKDNQILKMRRALDEQNVEIQEYKEQVAELEEKIKTCKAKFAARAEKWRQKVNKTAEEVFTDFQLKCQKQVKEHLHDVHEELADLRLDLRDSQDEEKRLLQELTVLQDDMDGLQRVFSAERWEDAVDSALRMKDRCAELERQSQENKDLRQEMGILRQELQGLRQASPSPVTLEEGHKFFFEKDTAILDTSLASHLPCGEHQT